jgi:glyoxylase-like metal-dependent hydrolase (beta-lactamase superfamily II)
VDANSWLITEENDGLLIDAVDNQDLYETITNLSSLTVILTHCHFDHIIGLNRIRELQPNIRVIATGSCSEQIGNKFRNLSSSATAFLTFYEQGRKSRFQIEPFTCLPADETFENEKKLLWKGHEIQLLAFHGHSNDSLIAVVDDRYLFSGDTLLTIPTVTRFPGGNLKRFREEDIPKLKAMKADRIYPGHGNQGNKDEMLAINQR